MDIRPSRISSEAPEVVNEHTIPETPDKYMVPLHFEEPVGPRSLFQQKKPDDRPLEFEVYPPPTPSPKYPPSRNYDPLSPHAGHDPLELPPISHVDARHHRERRTRACGLLATILIAIVAFIIGGALGGGIGGSFVVKEKDKVSQFVFLRALKFQSY